jgi:phosphate transport system substrate-binding protein
MSGDQLAKVQGKLVHIPMTLGAVVITYNLPGTPADIKLTPEALAGIFLGDIKVWNDEKLVKLNPGVTLTAQPITVVHRSDGSGTTAVFTDYLAKVSPTWKDKVGAGTSVKWPVGLGGKGNEGVAAYVQRIKRYFRRERHPYDATVTDPSPELPRLGAISTH